MPARDHSLAFRQGLVQHLRADTGVTDLVGLGVYGERTSDRKPEWPYLLVGTVIASPYTPAGLMGSDLSVIVHCFARGPIADNAYLINAAVIAAVDERAITLPGGAACMRMAMLSSQVINDVGSVSDWHGLVNISALTAEAI